jgi:type IV pilus biogenesis protein CpaD/CtpE
MLRRKGSHERMNGPRLRRILLISALAALAGCATTTPTFTVSATPAASATASIAVGETIDGYVLGPERNLTGDQFHRLEATSRDHWAAVHPGEILSGFVVRSLAGTATDTPNDFLMVVTVVGGERHVVALHCDVSTFPAEGSCAAS